MILEMRNSEGVAEFPGRIIEAKVLVKN